MCRMIKTTIYLPADLKTAIEIRAAEEGLSDAELIRRALRREVGESAVRKPRIPLIDRGLGDPLASERVDEYLGRFGEG